MTDRRLRFAGALEALGSENRRRLLERAAPADDMVRTTAEAIIDVVRRDGDAALIALAREFDKARLTSVEVARPRWREALEALDPALRAALDRAATNIRVAHEAFRPQASETYTEPGVLVGRRPDPLRRVGVYAPGGRAAYPSSLLMGVIPARVAGVQEVIVCSPPTAAGLPNDVLLAAAELAGADRVFAVGGAGAIAAMAYGTETIPRVERIVGPGNAYVAQAKLLVASHVGIDAPAGPSELVVIADASASPLAVAREVLAQAEHDPDAAVVVLAVGEGIADRVSKEIDRLVSATERRAIASRALAARGALLEAQSVDDAVAFSNDFAPEHLLLAIADPEAALPKVRATGAVFLGETSSVAFGDYLSGANHVLPTGGSARSYSGLGTADFVRWTAYVRVDRDAAARLAHDVGTLADAERLPAHAEAARGWRLSP